MTRRVQHETKVIRDAFPAGITCVDASGVTRSDYLDQERAKCATARLTIVIARLRIVFTRSARILHQSRPVVILADTRPGAPEIMFGIEHMGLPVGQSAESLGEVGKFALGYARAAPVGMLLAGLFDKAVLP